MKNFFYKLIIPVIAGLFVAGIIFAVVLFPYQGGTGIQNYDAGDIIVSTSTNSLGKLAIGSANQVLTVSGGLPIWATASGGSDITASTLGELKDVSTTTLAYGSILAWSTDANTWNSTSSLDVATATTTSITVTDLVSCDTIDTDASGNLVCGSDDSSAGAGNNWQFNGANILTPTSTIGIVLAASSTMTSLHLTSDLLIDGSSTSTGNFIVGSNAFTVLSSGVIEDGTWNATAIDFSDYTNATADTGIQFTADAIGFDCSEVQGGGIGCFGELIETDLTALTLGELKDVATTTLGAGYMLSQNSAGTGWVSTSTIKTWNDGIIVAASSTFLGDLTVMATSTLQQLRLAPVGTQAIAAVTDTISSSYSTLSLSADADYVMTSTPTVASSTAGTIIVLHNKGAFDVDLQANSTLAGSGIFNEGVDSIIEPNDLMTLMFFDDANGEGNKGWRVQSHPNPSAAAGSATLLDVRNVSGSTIDALKPVYRTGFNAGQGRVTVDLADGDDSTMMPAIGITFTSIANNQNGQIVDAGEIQNVDTSSFSAGDTLYVDTTAGALTATRPTVDEIQAIGRVLYSHATKGIVLVVGAGRTNDVPWNATTTHHYINDSFGINTDYFTDLTGAGLLETATVLTLDATGDWTGTLDSYEAAELLATSVTLGEIKDVATTTLANGSLLFWNTGSAGWLSQSTSTWNDFTTTTADWWFNNSGGVTGNTNIVTVGTIGTGIWEGTAIADGYLTKTGDWTGTLDGYEAAELLTVAATLGELKDVSTTTLAANSMLIWSGTQWNSSSTIDVASASTTNLAIFDLVSCDTIDTDATGNLKCGSDDSTAGDGSNWQYNGPNILTPTSTIGVVLNASSTYMATTTFENDIVMMDDQSIVFSDTDVSKRLFYNSGAGEIVIGGSGTLGAVGEMHFYSNLGQDGDGNAEPNINLEATGVLTFENTTQGSAGSMYAKFGFTDGLWINTGGDDAILMADLISGDKEFSFPNLTGTFLMATGTQDILTTGGATSTSAGITGLVSCDTIDTDASGNLKCGTDDDSAADGSSNWMYSGASTLTPTSTIGVYMNSSTTIQTTLWVKGATTSTDDFVVGANAFSVKADGTIEKGTWQGTAIADAYVPDNITIDLATLATTLTITDNESTAENNAVLFTAGGALEGGNLGIESDGTFFYTPSTGKVSATAFLATTYSIGDADIAEAELEILDGATVSTTQLNYINSATGVTGTNSTNIVFSTSPTLVTPTLGVASATSLTVTDATSTGTFGVGSNALLINSSGEVEKGTWKGTAIADAYITKTGDWTGTLDGYEAAQMLGGSNWAFKGASAITPTSSVGTIVNASSTFSGDFYVDGNSTTTGDVAFGLDSATDVVGCLAFCDFDGAGYTYCYTIDGAMECTATDVCSGAATSTVVIGQCK